MTRSVSITLCFSVIYATSAVGQSGIISTVGGTFRGFAGDDGPVKSAAFTLANKFNDCDPATYEQTSHLTIDKSGNLYIADTNNHRIRRINPNGIVTTVVGSGLRPEIDQFCGPIGGNAAIGEGGQSKAAKLNGPTQVIFDPSGNMVVVDQQNNRIRRVNAQGVLGTIVGGTLHQFYAPGTPATTTGLDWPIAVAYDAQGVLYFAELHSNRVAKVGADGRVTTVAGIGLPGTMGENVAATSGGLSRPVALAFDAAGNLYVTEQTNNRVRKITPQGILSTYAGKGTAGFSGDGGKATGAELNLPNGIAFDSKGNLYIADMANQRVRRVSADGIISTVAGNGNIDKAVDGAIATQRHPHDFIGVLAASYQMKFGERTSITFYGGPRGDPAIGPVPYSHRISASENPIATLGHHFQDSTHIATNVLTMALAHGPATLEVSGFHGREPDERRWNLEKGAIDSFATRLTITPTARWAGQVSVARINNRENTHPLRDSFRQSASLTYVRPFNNGHWASSLIWGRNHDLEFTQPPTTPEFLASLLAGVGAAKPKDNGRREHIVLIPTRVRGQIYNSYLAESTVFFRNKHWVYGRVETADKDSLLLFEEEKFVRLVEEQRYTRVRAYTMGYARELKPPAAWLRPAIGVQLMLYDTPANLADVYGAHPKGVQLFLRVRLAPVR